MELQKQTADDFFDMFKTMDMRLKRVEAGGGVAPGVPIRPSGTGNDDGNDNDDGDDGGSAGIGGNAGGSASSNNDANVLRPQGLVSPYVQPFVSNKKPLYSAMARGNVFDQRKGPILVDNDGFVVVGPNGRPRRAAAVNQTAPQKKQKRGELGGSSRSALSATERVIKASVFATRYPAGITEQQVKDDLKGDARVKDLDICVKSVKTKYDTYSSFHITCVCKEDEAKIFFENDLWPPRILYREWKEKRASIYQGMGRTPNNGMGFQYVG